MTNPPEQQPVGAPTHPTPMASGTVAPAPGGSSPIANAPVTGAPADGATTATPAPTDRKRSILLVLTGAFAALSLVLGGLLVVDAIEINRLRRELAARPSVAPTSVTEVSATSAPRASAPAAPRVTPQPTTGSQADLLRGLARRQAGDPLAIGKPDAPVVMIEWADYRCPYCAKWSRETLPQLKPYIDSGSLRVEFRDMVLFGEESLLVHRAARAAGIQGKYFEFADLLWAKHTGQGHPDYTDAELVGYATQLKLDVAKFNADRNSPTIKDVVEKESADGQQLGITGTPFFVVNTTPVSGALPTETFVQLIEASGGKK